MPDFRSHRFSIFYWHFHFLLRHILPGLWYWRGDDIDEVFRRDRADAREYRNIETAVDFILPNHNDFSDPENMAYWITDCLNGKFFKGQNG